MLSSLIVWLIGGATAEVALVVVVVAIVATVTTAAFTSDCDATVVDDVKLLSRFDDKDDNITVSECVSLFINDATTPIVRRLLLVLLLCGVMSTKPSVVLFIKNSTPTVDCALASNVCMGVCETSERKK